MYRIVSQQSNSKTSEPPSAHKAPGLPRRRAMALAVASIVSLAGAHAQANAEQATDAAQQPQAAVAGQAATSSTEKAQPENRIEIVTVTATRRREPLRDVPLRVETLRAEALQAAGAADLQDYVGSLPGVHVSSDGGPGRGQVSIRGVSVGGISSPTVGTYVDDVAFGSSTAFVGEAVSALDMSLLDLHHVEVLRGPQGTLYGAGAMGGLLKYVTNQPDSTGFSGTAGIGVRSSKGGALGHTEHAVVNIPLSEGVAAMRVAAFNEHDGGFIKAVGKVAGDHVNDGDTRGGRVSVQLDPTSKLRIRLTALQQNIDRNGTGIVQYNVNSGQPLYGDLTHQLYRAEPYTIKTGVLSADVEYDMGWARLNVIGSGQRFEGVTVLDATDIVGPPFNFAELHNDINLHKHTAEVRLTSPRGTIEWLAGYYHDQEKGDRFQRLWGQLPDNSEMTLVTSGQPSKFTENAVYGDLTYNPTSQWSITVGARVARNKQTYGTITNGTPDFSSDSKDSSTTYLATARYSIDKISSVYVRAASGYRPGGPNPPAIDQNGKLIPGAPTQFGPDSLWSYEAGYKADLLDKRLSFEAAVFDIRWDKLQQPLAIGATTLTTNAGKAESKGLELSARFKADDHLSLDGSLAWTDAKLTEDAPALGKSGSRLPNTAKLSASAGARYTFAVAGAPSFVGLNVRHIGDRNAGFDSAGSSVPNFRIDGYTLLDLQAGVEYNGWEVSAFARNVTDKRALSGADTALTAFGGPLRATPVAPRTIGINVARSF